MPINNKPTTPYPRYELYKKKGRDAWRILKWKPMWPSLTQNSFNVPEQEYTQVHQIFAPEERQEYKISGG